MQMQGSFDATQFAPKQGGGGHPIGKGFDAVISNTRIDENKAKDGGLFVVEFTTPVGRIENRYNLWNKTAKAVEIAHNELSALCHATGIFRLDFQNEGAALRNGRCKIDVALQDASQPDGYVEVSKVYDINGNEPGRAPAPAPQPQQQVQQPVQQQPLQQQPSGGWTQPNPAQNNVAQPIQQQPSGGWSQQAPGGNAAPSQPAWAQPPRT